MEVTDEVQHNTAIAGPSGRTTEESLAIGEIVDRLWCKDRVSPPDKVTCIGVGVTKADDGGEAALATSRVAGAKEREDEEHKECCVRCSHSGIL
jgi:hypothetical protein